MHADAKEFTDGGEFSDLPLPDPAPPNGGPGSQAPAADAGSRPVRTPAPDSRGSGRSSSRSARTDAAANLADPTGAGGAAAVHSGPRSWDGQNKGTTDPIAALAAALAEWTANPIKDKHPDPEEEALHGGAAFLRSPKPSAAPASRGGGVQPDGTYLGPIAEPDDAGAGKGLPDGSYLGRIAEPVESAPGLLDYLSGSAGAGKGQRSTGGEKQGAGGVPQEYAEGPHGKTAGGIGAEGARTEPCGGDFFTDEVAMDMGGADGAPAADAERAHRDTQGRLQKSTAAAEGTTGGSPDGGQGAPPESTAATEGTAGWAPGGKQAGAAHAEPRTGDFYTDEVAMDVGGADGAPAADAERHDAESGLSKGASAVAQARPSILAAPSPLCAGMNECLFWSARPLSRH